MPRPTEIRTRPGVAPAASASRRTVLKAGGTLLLSVLAPLPARAAQILAVRVWPAADYTRVTLENDSDLKANSFLVPNPDRLVVDIEGLDLNPTLKTLVAKIQANDPYIKQVRVGQNRPGVVRLVFDLKEPVKPQVFTLAPVGEYKHRLIFDLYPLKPVDPIAAMIEKGEWTHPETPSQTEAADAARAAAALAGQAGAPDAAGAATAAPGAGPSAPAVAARTEPASGVVKPVAPEGGKPDVSKPLAAADNRADAREAKAQASPLNVVRMVTIALDPGHGGEDPGATGSRGTHEKDIVLAIAKRLKAKLESVPNVRVMLTRDADYFVPLGTRVDKARKVQADLFVSIHADAFVEKTARGSSVFVLSEKGATSSAARWLAKNQNASDLIGGVNVRSGDKQLASVLFDLSTTAQINDSIKLGKAVLSEIGGINRLHRGAVEQAGFAVLKAPDIPSILVETAFISNPDEEAKLSDNAYQDQLADAITKGIKHYFAKNPPLAKSRMT